MYNFIFMLDEASDFCKDTSGIFNLLAKVIFILKIAIPIIIVLLAMIDLGKAVMAGEEKAIKEAQGMLVKRLIYGVCIFFVVTIVQVVFGLVNRDVDGSGGGAWCWKVATCTNPWGEPCGDKNPDVNLNNDEE